MWSQQYLMLFLFGAAVLFTCSRSAAEVICVAGYQGSEVQILCPYREGYGSNNYQYYLCKGSCGSDGDVLIETKIDWPTETEVIKVGRYSIRDDTKNRVFPVTITVLQLSDAGQYWCGVSKQGKDLYTEVQLEVVPDRCCDHVTTVQGYVESPISIRCPYTAKHQLSKKYFCRGHQASTCWQNALVTSDHNSQGRLTLNDDRAAGEFTVNMTNLSREDNGTRFLCGFHSYTSMDHFSALQLEVKEWCCVKTVELNGTEGHPIDIQCPYPPKHKLNAKFFCKGEHRNSCEDIVMTEKTHHDLRLSLQDNNSDSNQFLVTITALRAQDAGTYWCGSDKEWSAGDYTKIHLSVSLPQTTTVDTTSYEVSVTPVTDGLLIKYVAFIVPAALLGALALAIICKKKCNRDEGAPVFTDTSRKNEIHGSASCSLQLPNMQLQQTQPKDLLCTNIYEVEDDTNDDIYENTQVASEC